MSDERPSPSRPESADRPRSPSRRQVLGILGAGGAAAAGGYGLTRLGGSGVDLDAIAADAVGPAADDIAASATAMASPVAAATSDLSQRLLVVVELSGGNDGLASVVPMGDPTLARLRPELLPQPEGVVDFVDGVALSSGLEPLRDRGLAVLQGLGTPDPDGSHFEMEVRWWQGDPAGTNSGYTGFLGRLCDELDDGAPVTGVSVGSGSAPALLAEKATTIGLPDPWAGWFLAETDPWFRNLQIGLTDLGTGTSVDSAVMADARRGVTDALSFAELLGTFDGEENRGFPETSLGWQLSIASSILAGDAGIRVVHVPFGGFDTHDDQGWYHAELMTELGGAVAALQDDLAQRGLAERTLIATTSEFGRRPEQNAGGTDHGTAGPAFLAGPVTPGLHGDAPRLDRLDDDGNLVATMMFDDYYATIAERWFGISSDLVLAAGTPIDGLLL